MMERQGLIKWLRIDLDMPTYTMACSASERWLGPYEAK